MNDSLGMRSNPRKSFPIRLKLHLLFSELNDTKNQVFCNIYVYFLLVIHMA